ncbi:SpoVG family protein [bacterium]|nr:SpoVG family protein [bacterium]
METSIRVTGCKVLLNLSRDEHLKGFATIVLNDEFAVRDLKIINGNSGLFVAMPNRRRRDGGYHDVAHPILPALREHIEEIVLREYQIQLTKTESGDNSNGKHQDSMISM